MKNIKNYLTNKEYNKDLSKLVQWYLLSKNIESESGKSSKNNILIEKKDKLETEIKDFLESLELVDQFNIRSYFPQLNQDQIINSFKDFR